MLFFLLILFLMSFEDNNQASINLMLFNYNTLDILVINDKMTCIFLVLLLIIVFSIYLFKIYYMNKEESSYYFDFMFYSFVLSMIFLIYSQNWLMMIMGWDLLGVSSYFLIVFYKNSSSSNSGYVAMNTNRLGDAFLISFVAISFNKNLMENSNYACTMISLLVICLMTKSAQFPFSSWLPLAMSAPTPVSSLVHSSTLVTAGLFIIYKNEKLINNKLMMIMLIISLFTNIYSGFMANVEADMKKMIALSTLSQISFMFLSFSMGLIYLSFLHLLTHALFKASLFFWSGLKIHSSKNEQMFVSMNNKSDVMSMSFIFLVFISLLGIPFSIGFYSKDQIIDFDFMNFNFLYNSLMSMSVILTLMYTVRICKKMTSMNYNKLFFKMFYSNVYLILLSAFLFSVCLLSNKNLLENWFKLSFIVTTTGWKIMFFLNMLLMLIVSYKMIFFVNKKSIYKMLYLNNFTMKFLSMIEVKNLINTKNFDFTWVNKISLVMYNFFFKESYVYVYNNIVNKKMILLMSSFMMFMI